MRVRLVNTQSIHALLERILLNLFTLLLVTPTRIGHQQPRL